MLIKRRASLTGNLPLLIGIRIETSRFLCEDCKAFSVLHYCLAI
jgi:hypothetical protein